MASSFAWTLVSLPLWLVGCARGSPPSSTSTTGGVGSAASSTAVAEVIDSASAASSTFALPSIAPSSVAPPSIAPLFAGPNDPKSPLSIPSHWITESEELDRLLRDGTPDLLTEGWAASGKTCEHHFQVRRRAAKPAIHVEAFVAFGHEIGVSPSTDARGAVRLYADVPTKGPPFFALAEALDVIGGSNVFVHVKHPNVDVQACLRRYAAALPLGDLASLLELPGVSLDVVNVAREEGRKPSTMIRALVARRAEGPVIDWLLHHEFAPKPESKARSFTRATAEINLADGEWTLYVDRSR